jgi:hypothetical protein
MKKLFNDVMVGLVIVLIFLGVVGVVVNVVLAVRGLAS